VATGLIAGTAAAAIAAGILLLATAGSVPGPAGSGSGPVAGPTLTEATGCCRDVPPAVRAALEAMVSLQVTTAHGVVQECGVVVGAGGLVATTLDAVAGAREVTAVTAFGRRERAVVVAGDPGSDVAVLRVGGGLRTASFATGPTDVGQRDLVLAMAMARGARSTAGGSATMLWAGSTVRSDGAGITRGGASGMDGIDAASPSMPSMAGEVLVQGDGRVLGLLDRAATSRSTKVFLPAALVVGVARILAISGRVRHGWLDVVGADEGPAADDGVGGQTTTTAASRSPGGAVVVKVNPDGAAAGVLRPGDVITSIDRAPLSSMADLRSRLYVTSPGERVELGVRRGRTTLSVDVDLSASP
jgi:S1-C subfamily serine protease